MLSLRDFTWTVLLAVGAAMFAVALCLAATIAAYAADPKPGTTFKDCADCPVMVVIPPGTFLMGSQPSETAREKVPERDAGWERPQHRVVFRRPFAMGLYPVTFGEWHACLAAGGCNGYRPANEAWRKEAVKDDEPVYAVSFADAESYVTWLNGATKAAGKGAPYALPSEAEWEYGVRAGTKTARPWGDEKPDYLHEHVTWPYEFNRRVGRYPSNAFGLYDLLGPYAQWTADCWADNYAFAPADGRPRSRGNCQERVIRGGTMDYVLPPRSAARSWRWVGLRLEELGFRVARRLP